MKRQVPAELEVHLVPDNSLTHKTPAIKQRLAAHPGFVVHFTPTSASWPNLFERWFGELTNKTLRRNESRHSTAARMRTTLREKLMGGAHASKYLCWFTCPLVVAIVRCFPPSP